MAGNQSRGLIAASKTRGWDPTVIPGSEGTLANFDKDQTNLVGFNDSCIGKLPEGTPDAYRDGYDVPQLSAEAPITWTAPDFDRENANRRTVNADPDVAADGGRG